MRSVYRGCIPGCSVIGVSCPIVVVTVTTIPFGVTLAAAAAAAAAVALLHIQAITDLILLR
jgi:hypothetical protein